MKNIILTSLILFIISFSFADTTIPGGNVSGEWTVAGSPSSRILYSHPVDCDVNLSVYNLKGQKVNTLVNKLLPAGKHSAIWNGKDSDGKSVSSGIYFYKLKTGDYLEVKKMLLLK